MDIVEMAGFLRISYKTIDMKRKFYTSLLIVFLFLSYTGLANSLPEGEDLSLYPNPATSELTIKIGLDYISNTQLQIIDLTGKVVKDSSKEMDYEHGIYKAKLDISDLKTGIYFVKVTQPNKVFTKKLLVR